MHGMEFEGTSQLVDVKNSTGIIQAFQVLAY